MFSHANMRVGKKQTRNQKRINGNGSPLQIILAEHGLATEANANASGPLMSVPPGPQTLLLRI